MTFYAADDAPRYVTSFAIWDGDKCLLACDGLSREIPAAHIDGLIDLPAGSLTVTRDDEGEGS
jgi:hypothetical protein